MTFLKRSPLGGRRVIHVAHHKAGTTWFKKVFAAIAEREGLSFDVGHEFAQAPTADIVVYYNTRHVTLPDGPWRGSHMVRDPRDMIVSAYHYHLWSDEWWLQQPVTTIVETAEFAHFGERPYQECLKELDRDAGLHLEIERFARWDGSEMQSWPYGRAGFLELRYEDVLADEAAELTRLFRHYGFSPKATRRHVELASAFSLDRVKGGEGTHVRSGQPGQWKEHFTSSHVDRFKSCCGDLVSLLGYDGADWTSV